ncbi:malate synthase G, partial [Tsukamurella pulmonis]
MVDTARTSVAGLEVATVLYDFINDEALPGTGVDQAAFWEGAAKLIADLVPKNKALLATRDELQAKIDAYHAAAPGEITDFPAYKQFLTEIGYLVPVPEDREITTSNVDSEITSTAGPQLVVPILNARFAINAANARWGSLYDALYGTDAISEADGAEKGKGYNKVRGDKVIAFAKDFLDKAVPLESGSHADVIEYRINGTELLATVAGASGSSEDASVCLADPAAFVGYTGDKSAPSGILLRH